MPFNKFIKIVNIILICIIITCSCNKEKSEPSITDTGKISIKFLHNVAGDSLIRNSLVYTNLAGNQYEISELKYFISDLVLFSDKGEKINIYKWKQIHYVDLDYENTLQWDVFDDIPVGNYDSISFVFGIDEQKNKSFYFVNPPEVNMFWPEILGGGYHYMMLNGKWKTNDNQIFPFNFHLGIGQIYSGTSTSTDSIIGYVQNYFKVTLKTPELIIEKSKTKIIKISMDINSWFETPHVYNHDYWGCNIMQNQNAMLTAKENGFDVFSIKN